ncbi:efflux transporter outer membrane subunit [Chitiniphilus purpureus]|uniref:Efflux transporter outer membrane subunit n=1 Tax=Chitiniphilus purpureus TaxID=2981137 RepID=A0ABY6DJY6_9NEIS|nr:efflux transporter outer membrane subunit [Chitiniphilus sp. CD1]UXY13751.1 efflux transporter outer membrane subunit [Chitiniphilus sp. CD1]
MQQRIFMLLPIAALLGACSMAPKYERPPLPVPGQVGSGAEAAAASVPGWQDYFADPSLRTLIEQALENNRDLRIAVARIEEARALYGVTRADRLPTLAAGAGMQAGRTPGTLTPDGTAQTSRRYDVNLGITAFEVDFWGRVKSLSDAARNQYLATEEAQRAMRATLIADVANAYWNARAFDERAELAGKTAKSLEESAKVIDRRLDAGLANRLDALQAGVAVDEARVSQADLERQARNARNALQVLTGAPAMLPAAAASLVTTLPQTRVPDGLSSTVLLDRPDVRQAEYALQAANANIGAARAAFFPRVTLTGSAGTAGAQLSDLFDGGSRAWSFVPQISLPIFDAGRNRANLDLAEARKVIAVAEYERAVQVAFREVANVLSDQQGLQEYMVAQERVVARQGERLKAAQARYDAGLVGYLDVLEAQRAQLAAQQSLIDAARARLAVTAEAFKALGGDEPPRNDN